MDLMSAVAELGRSTSIPQRVHLRVLRQHTADGQPYWQEFEVPFREKMNVISALIEVQKNPQTTNGASVSPPVWEAACLEEVCGSCTMVINGTVRQACTALIENVGELRGDKYFVELQPMTKFPTVKDLIVDRRKMFENLKKVAAWVPIDGSYDLGSPQPQDDAVRQFRYSLSRCMTCGCCLEVCPQVSEKSAFVGPAAIGQAVLFNLHPVGHALAKDRLEFLSSEEGVTGCGNAQNCVKICPKGVPLTEAIAEINRETTIHTVKKWIGIIG